jgi:hypothetical protein
MHLRLRVRGVLNHIKMEAEVFQQSIKLPLQQLGLVLFGVIKRQNVH